MSRGTTLLVGAPGRCIHLRGKLVVLSAAEREDEEDGHGEQEEEEGEGKEEGGKEGILTRLKTCK